MSSQIEVNDLTPGNTSTAVFRLWATPLLTCRFVIDGEASGPFSANGWQRVSVTFTPTAADVTASIERVSGHGIAYMELLTLVESSYTGDPFDGNTPNRGNDIFEWEADENDSPSTRNTLVFSGPTANRYADLGFAPKFRPIPPGNSSPEVQIINAGPGASVRAFFRPRRKAMY